MRRNQFAGELEKVIGSDVVGANFTVPQKPKNGNDGQLFLQVFDFIPGEPQLGVEIFRHVYFKKELALFFVTSKHVYGVFG